MFHSTSVRTRLLPDPEIYEYLEEEAYGYAIRLPANDILMREIAPLLVPARGTPHQRAPCPLRGF